MVELKKDVWKKMSKEEQDDLLSILKEEKFMTERLVVNTLFHQYNEKYHTPKAAEIEYGMAFPNKDGEVSTGNDYCYLLLKDGAIRIPISPKMIRELKLHPNFGANYNWDVIIPKVIGDFSDNLIDYL
jgi:hypothetical protein